MDNEQLPKGYKNTEVGVIPEDWEIHTFGDIVDYTKGFAFKSKDYRKDGIRIIRVSDTTFDSIKKENGIYVDEKSENEYKNWRLEENDLIFTTVGSKPPMYDSMVGKVIMIAKENAGSFLNQNAVLIRSKKRTKEKQSLLLSHFRTKRYLQHIELIYRGNANQASITLKELFEFKIPLPKEESEQTAIATALSDADALINCIEKLIAKKRNIKQGTMQQLLKPKEGWKVKKLGEISDILDNLRKPLNDSERQQMKGDIPYCGANGIVDYVDDFVIDDDIILMAEDGGYFDEYKTRPIAYRMKGKCWVNNHAHILKAKKEIDQDFLFYSLVNKNILDFINGGTRAKLNKGELINILVAVSPSKEEQTRIATILSDMDAEIQALETKLEKYRKIKLGMMQNLLTGKIRLI